MQQPAGMTPAEVVIDVFGGIRPAARAAGVEASTVLRWQRRGGVPDEYKRDLLDAAKRRRLLLSLEELTWGRPKVGRRVVSFDLDIEPVRRTPATAFGQLARALTAEPALA